MNLLSTIRARLPRGAVVVLVATVTGLAVVAVVSTVDAEALGRAARTAQSEPLRVLAALAAFGFAFVLRAAAWRRILPGLGFGHALAGIHLALGGNHLLPLRLGEPLRVVSVVRRAGVGFESATASTVALRSADFITVIGLGLVAGPAALAGLAGWGGWLVVAAVVAASAAAWLWLRRLAGPRNHAHTRGTGAPGFMGPRDRAHKPHTVVHRQASPSAGMHPPHTDGLEPAGTRLDVRMPGPAALGLSAAAWLAEGVLVWQAAHWAGLEIGYAQALGVTAVSVAAQIAAIAPGGFGTYEAAAVGAYVALGHDAGDALVAALGAHALKTAYSLAAGAVAMVAPSPSLAGRLRLHRPVAPSPGAATEQAGRISPTGAPPAAHPTAPHPAAAEQAGPIVLFMPAHNEEESVGACVRRAPAAVLGRPVEVLVMDDGSTDATAHVAAAAGAEVISLPTNRGLGAAVRLGLAEAVGLGAAAVAFCDADGEYPPEELEALIAPILAGEADYVAGSRFLGRIHHMRPHRRLGNLVLTRALSIVARCKITDGQTGYRAFSALAAANAEIIHDYNYAQVLTLDLLAKGYRYAEVPISYRFRTTGQSFVKLGRYLRNVVPAVYRELNSVAPT